MKFGRPFCTLDGQRRQNGTIVRRVEEQDFSKQFTIPPEMGKELFPPKWDGINTNRVSWYNERKKYFPPNLLVIKLLQWSRDQGRDEGRGGEGGGRGSRRSTTNNGKRMVTPCNRHFSKITSCIWHRV